MLRLVTEQRDRGRGLQQRLAHPVHHHRGGVLQAVEHPHEPGTDVVVARHPPRRVVPGQPEQVVALVERQPQAAGDRPEHLLRRLRPALLLEPAVVVGRHAAQRGDLLAAQARGAPPRAARQPDVLGLQRLAAGAQQVGEPGRGPSR
ncbi:hypothetical protein GCM10025868_25250 [Angustibacter aerolatus]|uniref:Uncharacterized protein n=1 Tax=Angustibacter aerolatus TaxID=1162965 RepID=A0ABQ6JJ61_9ACTN|nr:hypothetical protein GCM10025868_25250 [Angustibacter aerolatus]